MKKTIRCIEIVVQVITVIMSLFTAVQIFNSWAYKRKLARKAQEYLEDEFVPEANMGKTINVYSPTVTKNQNNITALLAATGVSCIILVIINLFKISNK